MGSESHPVDISFPRPTAPSITGGEVVFDQSRGSATITVEWEPVVSFQCMDYISGISIIQSNMYMKGKCCHCKDYCVGI